MSSSNMESVRNEGNDRDALTSITSEYDVFLSFRGPDARLGIVDHLYECMTGVGLHVFKDDEEIRRGEGIRGELLRAIVSSRVYAVVLSRNYASSLWCLRELDMMVDLQGGSNVGRKIILPIFYGADPADVKLRTGLYREALDTHKVRHGDDVVKKWEEALMMVGRISRWDSKAFQGEGRFVRLIVQDILGKLRFKDQNLPVRLTGIDDRVTDMLNLLDCDSMGVRLVVLHGMGGIGKTTLACFIFNELRSMFEGSSFISNIRESFTGNGCIAKLLNKLSRDILGGQYARSCNSGDEFDEIIPRIRGKRILLVLDDVDELSQLKKLIGNNPEDTLGTGSRVIITTRNKTVCRGFVCLDSEVLQFYEMEKMHDNHALQLFSRHAFGIDDPPEDYISLSKQVVETTGNLPLALEVIAGHLCCQSKESWMYTLEKLKNVPQKEVFEILKVSYRGLDFREREIFLDIACFQPEMPRRYAYYLWKARKLYPETAAKVLINRSLIKISSNSEFWIHDQLRDMGREIIRSESLGSPEMCTRLWDPDDVLKIMLQKEVSKKIIAMKFGRYDEAHKFSYENFRGLSNLLYLHLNWTQFIGDFGDLQEKLMWLSWSGSDKKLNSDFFKMSNLVVLKIDSFVGEWRGEEKMIVPNLRVLEIRRGYMMTTPDVSCCLKLEIMVFESLGYLKEIHPSVGGLVNLTYLKISGSKYLGSLPKELCCARALQELTVTKTSISEVPESFGMLESLRTLNLRDNKIRTLPTSIRDLKNLLVLDAGVNPLDRGIPEEIGSISALEYFDISCSMLRLLPATISQLSSLKSLKINNCGMLQELPRLPTSLTMLFASSCPLGKGIHEENGNLLALENLDLSRSRIRFLPASVSRLSSLKTLKLQHCKMLRELPRLPTNLTVLSAPHCPLDEGISEEIGSLPALENLDLSGSQIQFLPVTISRLLSLNSLKLDGCDMLQELPELPTSLTELTFSSKSLRAFPDFAVLTNITELKLSDGIDCTKDYEGERLELSGLGRLEKLKSLVLSRMITFSRSSELGSLSKLETIHLSFPDMASVPELPSSLRKLTILHSRTSIPWERYSNLRLLTELELLNFTITDIELGGLNSLPHLTTLSIEASHSLLGVSNLGRLRGLKSLRFGSCGALMEIPGLEQLQLLEELTIAGCNSICGIQNLLGLQRLKSVRIGNCSSWLRVPRMMDDCQLNFWGCGRLPPFFGTYREYERKQGQQTR